MQTKKVIYHCVAVKVAIRIMRFRIYASISVRRPLSQNTQTQNEKKSRKKKLTPKLACKNF